MNRRHDKPLISENIYFSISAIVSFSHKSGHHGILIRGNFKPNANFIILVQSFGFMSLQGLGEEEEKKKWEGIILSE